MAKPFRMRKRPGKGGMASAPKLFTAEHSSLPTITLNNDGKGKSFTAYVTSYVVSKQRQMLKGNSYHEKYLLWYLSMVASPGNGTALQAIYSSLVTTNNRDVHLDGVGSVAIGTKSDYLEGAGYSAHFNYDQQRVALPGGTKALHGILEPKCLTYVDPQKALAQARTRSKKGSGGDDAEGSQQGKRESVSLSTASSGAGNADAWTQLAAQEEKPFFLLLVPGMREGDTQFVADLYRSYLDRRVPYPLRPEWALPLWQATTPGEWERNYEVQTLKVWSYPQPWGKQEQPLQQQQDEELVPMISEAYLCKPDAQKIARMIKELVLKDTITRVEEGAAA